MDAVVLAGGKCLRMQDHRFKGLPKILYPLNKDSLIVDEILMRLKVAGIDEVYFSVNTNNYEIIKNYLTGAYKGFSSKNFIVEDEPSGTGGWLNYNVFHDDFLVMNGDILTTIPLGEFILTHKKNNAVATLLVREEDDCKDWGTVVLDDGMIVAFEEKTSQGSGFVSSGVYIFSPVIFKYVGGSKVLSLEKDLFPKLASQSKLYALCSNKEWHDVGTLERWNDYLKMKKVVL